MCYVLLLFASMVEASVQSRLLPLPRWLCFNLFCLLVSVNEITQQLLRNLLWNVMEWLDIVVQGPIE